MDIVTHAITGGIVASPFLTSHPVPAAAFALGSALPDLDSVSRLFGKRAFLHAHQTYTHSIPLIIVLSALLWWACAGYGPELQQAILALGAAMILHALMDLSNTYGVKILFPLSNRRFCLGWLFFIDATVVTINVLFLVWVCLTWPTPPVAIAISYAAVLLGYWGARFVLRMVAESRGLPETVSLVPIALWPWIYLGCRRWNNTVQTYRLNAFSSDTQVFETIEVLDEEYIDVLDRVPECRAMRQLTPAYHVVSTVQEGGFTTVICRDLRTTNFATRFGQLDLVLDSSGHVVEKSFHV